PGLSLPELSRHVDSSHAFRHDHIREKQINAAVVLVPRFKSLDPGGGLDDAVLIMPQNITYEFTQHRLVFHQENRLLAAADERRSGRGFGRHVVFPTSGRKIDSERGATANLAVDFNPTPVLLDDAVHGCQPKSGPFANFFGRE